jgi:hypothetical protein
LRGFKIISITEEKMKNVLAVLVCAAALFAACASNPAAPAGGKEPQGKAELRDESGVTIAAVETKILDWQGRTARAAAIPQWIADIQLNKFDNAARELSETDIGNSIYRGLTISGPDLRGAQMRADLNFARTIARELQQSINVFLASSSNGMPQATTEAMKELTQTKSQVELSGARQIAEFWQVAESADPANGRKTRETVLYRLYGFKREDWAAITGGYVQKILDQLPARQRPEEKDVANMLAAMLGDARHPVELSQRERELQVAAQDRMVNAQIDQMPAEQRRAAQLELAKLYADTSVTLNQQNNERAVTLNEQNNQGMTQRTQAVAQSAAEQVNAVSQSNAERAAYASGSPVLQTAAATTAADKPLVDAAKLAARIIF